jgi:hypothetical protein
MVLLDDGIVNGNAVVIKRGAKYITLEHIHNGCMDVWRANVDSFESLETENIVAMWVRVGFGRAGGIFRRIKRYNWKLYREARSEERTEHDGATYIKQTIKVQPCRYNCIGIIER